MIRPTKDTPMLTGSPQQSLDTVPAAWPTGVSSLTQALEACQRQKAVQSAPLFRRNAVELTRDKAAKERS